jgi:hypothetical protein
MVASRRDLDDEIEIFRALVINDGCESSIALGCILDKVYKLHSTLFCSCRMVDIDREEDILVMMTGSNASNLLEMFQMVTSIRD